MLEALKEQVWQANLDLRRSGLVPLTWGNVSAIDRETGLVVIKPSGVPYDKLTAESMAVVGIDGRPADRRLSPSTDTPTHLELYRAFPEIGGVAHTHSVHATAFAQACREIPCLGTTHADHFFGPVPVTRVLTPKEVDEHYEAWTGRVIVERMAGIKPLEMPAVLVAHHGPFTWGRTAAEAAENSIALEAVAEMALGTLRLEKKAGDLPRHLLEKHFTRKHGPRAYYGQGNGTRG